MDELDLNGLYAHPAPGRPWVRLSFVTTLDGSVADSDGRSGRLGGEADLAAFRTIRKLSDVVLVGAGTARVESYGPIDDGPRLALVSASLEIPDALIREEVIVITCKAADEKRRAALDDQVDLIVAGTDTIDWPAALAALDERGLRRVLCEGGPRLAGALARHDLIDELCLTVAPTIVGGAGFRLTRDVGPVDLPMRLAHVEPVGDVLLTRWLRDRT